MRKSLYFLPFVCLCILMISCGKEEVDLPIIEVETALDYAAKFVTGIEANQETNHVDTYISSSQDADFAELLENTNDAMAYTGFDYFGESKVYTKDDVLFYPVLRSSEQESNFLNMCIPFYRLSQTDAPTLLMEGPGVVAVGVLSDWYNGNNGGGRTGGNIIPLVAENPGMGSFASGYSTSYYTANGKVIIDYDRRGFQNEGTLRIIVKSSDADANLDKTWLIKF